MENCNVSLYIYMKLRILYVRNFHYIHVYLQLHDVI